jgi:hypothetical protein
VNSNCLCEVNLLAFRSNFNFDFFAIEGAANEYRFSGKVRQKVTPMNNLGDTHLNSIPHG